MSNDEDGTVTPTEEYSSQCWGRVIIKGTGIPAVVLGDPGETTFKTRVKT